MGASHDPASRNCWASIDGYDDDKIVEITVEDGKPIHMHTIGTGIGISADQLDRYGVRLIERVLPAGAAATCRRPGPPTAE